MAWKLDWNRRHAILALILIAGGGLRAWRLGEAPVALFVDEVALGLNAHFLGTRGRDLNNERLPLFPKLEGAIGHSGVIAQPVYQYAAIPFVRMFGLNAEGVRATSVFFGLLGILTAYLLGSRLAGPSAGLLAAAFLAVSPWHFHFSRVAFEAISLPPILAFGAWLLLGAGEAPRRLYLGAAVLALATYAYPTAKLFAPLLFAGYWVCFRTASTVPLRHRILAVCLFLLIILPNARTTLFGEAAERTRASSIMLAPLDREHAVRWLKRREGSPAARAILETRALLIPCVFVHNYASALLPRFLFIMGDDNPRHHIGRFGMCHFYYFPLLALGIARLWRSGASPESRFLIFWLLAYPIPGSLATSAPHAIRSIHALPALDVIAALGAADLWAKSRTAGLGFPRRAILALFMAGLAAAAAVQSAVYLRNYFGEYAEYSGCWWNRGMKEAIEACEGLKPEFDRIYVDAGGLPDAYPYLLFFGGADLGKIDLGESREAQLRRAQYYFEDVPETVTLGLREALLTGSNWSRLSEFRQIGQFGCRDNLVKARLLLAPAAP